MNLVFPVRWKSMWRHLTIFMASSIAIPLAIFLIFRYISSGFDYQHAFKHIPLFSLPLVFIGILAFSALFAFLFALYFKLAKITISDGCIYGKNYWGFKNKIPLDDIIAFEEFSNNGINAIIVKSRYHGKIYISDHTERIDELLNFLSEYLPKDDAEQGAAANP